MILLASDKCLQVSASQATVYVKKLSRCSQSKSEYLVIVDRLLANGALGVISGCTEIELLIHPEDLQVPMFPTAYLHAVAAVDFALSE